MAAGDKSTDQQTGLLPAGLRDVLHPQAENDARASEIIMSCLSSFGYQRVEPPLVEFEDSLLSDKLGAALSDKTFRLLDPLSHKMMALRADMTAQMARISGTRLAHLPRPLRLSYCGAVMRVVPDVLNPERQMVQAGAEYIGASDAVACAEMISLAVHALGQTGITELTIDMGIPYLFDEMIGDVSDDDRMALDEAIRSRDTDALRRLSVPQAALLADLVTAAGQDSAAIAALADKVDGKAAYLIRQVLEVESILHQIWPALPITLDLLDRRDADYHQGLHFAIYGKGLRGEIARGGAYVTGFGEPATGLSIYMERVLRALPAAEQAPRIYVSASAGLPTAMALVARGRDVVMGQADCQDDEAAAHEQGCRFIMRSADGMPEALE